MNCLKICLLFFIVACAYAITLKEFNRKMVCEVNKEREKHGLPYLAISSNLSNAAQNHTKYQYNNNKMTHDENIKGYRNIMDRIKKAGYKNPSAAAENVARGQRSIAEVMKGWMNSSGHRANILNSRYTHFGAGKKGQFWTQDFAASFDGKPKNVKKCP